MQLFCMAGWSKQCNIINYLWCSFIRPTASKTDSSGHSIMGNSKRRRTFKPSRVWLWLSSGPADSCKKRWKPRLPNIRGNMFSETEPRWKEFDQLNDTCPFHLLGTCTSSEWKNCLCTNTVVAFWINQDRYEFLWRLNEWQAKLPEEFFEGASSSALTASYWAMTSLSRCNWSAHMKSGCWRSTSAIQSNSGTTLIQAIGLLALKQ